MTPVPFADSPAAARARVLAAIRAEPRAVILDEAGPYIHAAVSTRFFHFVDDVELFVDSVAHRIAFRSSARLGYNDWGVNRARMERLQARLRM